MQKAPPSPPTSDGDESGAFFWLTTKHAATRTKHYKTNVPVMQAYRLSAPKSDAVYGGVARYLSASGYSWRRLTSRQQEW
jgi:hypothetical protein